MVAISSGAIDHILKSVQNSTLEQNATFTHLCYLLQPTVVRGLKKSHLNGRYLSTPLQEQMRIK